MWHLTIYLCLIILECVKNLITWLTMLFATVLSGSFSEYVTFKNLFNCIYQLLLQNVDLKEAHSFFLIKSFLTLIIRGYYISEQQGSRVSSGNVISIRKPNWGWGWREAAAEGIWTAARICQPEWVPGWGQEGVGCVIFRICLFSFSGFRNFGFY